MHIMLLERAITQHYSTPINNHLRSSSNIRNQAVVQDGRVDIQSKNVGYAGNGNRNAGRQNRNQVTNARNGLVQSIEEYDQNAQRNPRTESTPGKTNMLLALKDEDGAHLDDEENDFMLDNAYGDNTLEELNAAKSIAIHTKDAQSLIDMIHSIALTRKVIKVLDSGVLMAKARSVALQGGRVVGGSVCKKGDEGGVCLVTKYCSKQGGKEVGKVLGGDVVVRSWKLTFICHWANPFKDFERSNVPRIKLSSFSESDDTFTSLQALSNLHYLFSGFMDYFWSRELNISNFGRAN
ncbi:hypothetical protein Tco_0860713, partial [Tanacetum coccineum]